MTTYNLTDKTGIIGGGGSTTGGGSKTTVETTGSVALGVTNTRYAFRLATAGNTITFPSDNSAFEITILDAGGNFGLPSTGGLLINGVTGQTIGPGASGENFSCNYNYFLGTFSRAQGSSKINFDPQMTSAVPPASATQEGTSSGNLGWPGNTTGTIPVGKIGNSGSNSDAAAPISTGNYSTSAVTFLPGSYFLSGSGNIGFTTAPTITFIRAAISSTINNFDTDIGTLTSYSTAYTPTGQGFGYSIPSRIINVATTTTFYIVQRLDFTGGSGVILNSTLRWFRIG